MKYYNRLRTPQGLTELNVPVAFYRIKALAAQLCPKGQRSQCTAYYCNPDDTAQTVTQQTEGYNFPLKTFTVSPRN